MQTSYSYLDVVGRTTVVLKKKNVVGEHNVPFQVLVNILMKHCLTTPLNHASLDSNLWNILATSGVLWIQSDLHAGGTIDASICSVAVLCRLHCLSSHGSFHRKIIIGASIHSFFFEPLVLLTADWWIIAPSSSGVLAVLCTLPMEKDEVLWNMTAAAVGTRWYTSSVFSSLLVT